MTPNPPLALEPCPCCNGPAEIYKYRKYNVRCSLCGVGIFDRFSQENANKIWNTRSRPTLPVEGLQSRLNKIAKIIEDVDFRCSVTDGHVRPTLHEMNQMELSEIYKLAKGEE